MSPSLRVSTRRECDDLGDNNNVNDDDDDGGGGDGDDVKNSRRIVLTERFRSFRQNARRSNVASPNLQARVTICPVIVDDDNHKPGLQPSGGKNNDGDDDPWRSSDRDARANRSAAPGEAA